MRYSPTLNDFKSVSEYIDKCPNTTVAQLSLMFKMERRCIEEIISLMPKVAKKILPDGSIAKIVNTHREHNSKLKEKYKIDFLGWYNGETKEFHIRTVSELSQLRRYIARECKKYDIRYILKSEGRNVTVKRIA